MTMEEQQLPKITILLATYNRAHLVGETLLSIQEQTYTNWECVIVDDHSNDDTFAVVQDFIKEDPRFSYFLKTDKYKKGLSGTRNYGLALARSGGAEFIQFFDDDDIMHPEKLELQILPFSKDHDLDLTICQYRKFKQKDIIEFDLDKADDGLCKIKTDDLLKSFFLYQINLNSLGPLWKATKIMKYTFNEELQYAEERDFYLRIFLNEKINYLPIAKVLFWYRKHPIAITGSMYKNKNIKLNSIAIHENEFLECITKHKRAPFFLLKSYTKRGIKNNRLDFLNIISNYIKSQDLMWYPKYFLLWTSIKLYFFLNKK